MVEQKAQQAPLLYAKSGKETKDAKMQKMQKV